MNTISKAARRATRNVMGGSRDLGRKARKAHRANRRDARCACRKARLDGDTTHTDNHKVGDRDIS